MRFAGVEGTANTHQEGDGVFLDKSILPLLGGQSRVEIFQLLGCNKGNFGGQSGQNGQLGEDGAQEMLCVGQGGNDVLDGLL